VSAELCRHCLLPVRRGGYAREVEGEPARFCCYGCALAFQVRHGQHEEAEAAGLLIRLGAGGFLSMNVMLFSLLLYTGALAPADDAVRQAIHWLLWALATAVVIVLGGPFMREAWRAVREGRLVSDSLISLGALSAYGYSTYEVLSGGEAIYFDTVTMVLVLFTLGRYLEAIGRARAARSLAPLLAAERAEANVVGDGTDQRRPVRELAPGSVVRVRPGERMPVDGIVIEGVSQCDEAILTGEPKPQVKTPGATVYAGSLNGNGQLLVRMTAAGQATRWGEISAYVRRALARPGGLERLVDRVAAVFVPAVIALAIGVVAFWSQRLPFEQALMIGLAVLVVACPCALGLAAPLATSHGMGRAIERGVLVRNGGVLEALARVRTVAFDKTGTLTRGVARLTGLLAADAVPRNDLLRHAGAVALGSEHALGAAIVAAARARRLDLEPATGVQVYPGEGVVGRLGDRTIAVGSSTLMSNLGWQCPHALLAAAHGSATSGRSLAYVGWNGRARGLLFFVSDVAPETKPMLEAVERQGLSIALLSGDRPAATRRVAEALGIDCWEGGLSAEDKVSALSALAKRGPVAMVGDGLNDGPALASAAVSIAVGGATDLARETADIALPAGGLREIPGLIALARRVRRTITANIAWAFGYNLVALGAASIGLLRPVLAAALMAGSSVFVLVRTLAHNAHPNRHRVPAPIQESSAGVRLVP
jgi:Cu2+-exporting ATPase